MQGDLELCCLWPTVALFLVCILIAAAVPALIMLEVVHYTRNWEYIGMACVSAFPGPLVAYKAIKWYQDDRRDYSVVDPNDENDDRVKIDDLDNAGYALLTFERQYADVLIESSLCYTSVAMASAFLAVYIGLQFGETWDKLDRDGFLVLVSGMGALLGYGVAYAILASCGIEEKRAGLIAEASQVEPDQELSITSRISNLFRQPLEVDRERSDSFVDGGALLNDQVSSCVL